jgi:hypothetical protein
MMDNKIGTANSERIFMMIIFSGSFTVFKTSWKF